MKWVFKISTVLFILIISFAFLQFIFYQIKIKTIESKDAHKKNGEKELTYLKVVLAENLIPFAKIEVSALENIEIEKDNDSEYLALTLFPGQAKKNSGIRSEISVDFPFKENDTIEYSWQLRIPQNFPADDPQNRWWVFAQCHDQPDLNKGETWDTYIPHSPPIIFGYGKLENKDIIGFSTGLDGSKKGIEPIGSITISKNTWHTFRFIVKWSQKENGEVKVFFDGAASPIFSAKGPNMLNAYQHYFKVGQYRHAGINTLNTVHIKNIKIKKL